MSLSRFVDLILREGAHVDVKNKKGNSPLWLAANGELTNSLTYWHTCSHRTITWVHSGSTYTYKQGYPKHFEKAHRADIIREKSVNCEFYVVANFEFRSFSLLPHASCHHATIQEVIWTWWSCWLTTDLISTVKTTGRSRASWPHLERLIFPLTSLSIQDLFLLLRCSFFHLFFLVLHSYDVTLVSPITGSFQGCQVPGRPCQPVPVRCRPQEIRVHPLWQGVWDLYLYVCVCVYVIYTTLY